MWFFRVEDGKSLSDYLKQIDEIKNIQNSTEHLWKPWGLSGKIPWDRDFV